MEDPVHSTTKGIHLFIHCKGKPVHCMVYLPSNGHIVTLGSTRNMQCSTPSQ